MDKLDRFYLEEKIIRQLDFAGNAINSDAMLRQYQRRNSFGLDRHKKIHRIFQRDFYEKDVSDGYITLPRAKKNTWNDPLENPLSDVLCTDTVTGRPFPVDSLFLFFALCWTDRSATLQSDWESFSHGKESVRVSTTVGKLMDRIMHVDDSCYMHRFWLVDVEYQDPLHIQAMKNSEEIYSRLETSGSLLAMSAAIVRTQFIHEDEVRLLFDASIQPQLPDITYFSNSKNDFVRIPFNWNGFVDNEVFYP